MNLWDWKWTWRLLYVIIVLNLFEYSWDHNVACTIIFLLLQPVSVINMVSNWNNDWGTS